MAEMLSLVLLSKRCHFYFRMITRYCLLEATFHVFKNNDFNL